MSDEEQARLERIEGQIAAIGMTLNVMLKNAANQTELIDLILERAERLQAHLLASHVPDEVRESAEKFVHQWVGKLPPE